MTNAMIILNEQCRLLEEGILKPTGRVFEYVDGDGNKVSLPEAEEIHTYQKWKELGYQVQKGQKAIAKFPIWKYVEKKAESEDEKGKMSMFMKNSSWFSRSQVEEIKEA